MNTEAIAKAIAACNKAGGGRVVIPEGEWLTGPVHFKSNVNLHLEENAILRFTEDVYKRQVIYMSELIYRACPSQEFLREYADMVEQTAAFMASFVNYDSDNDRYIIQGACGITNSTDSDFVSVK